MVNINNEADIMKAFFSGKIKYEPPEQPKLIELGQGKGIGHKYGTYSQYIEQLKKQKTKGNGSIYLGKSVVTDKEMFSMQNTTDKFAVGDIPHILIKYNNIIRDVSLKILWKDSLDDTILEQFYMIPSAYSMGSSWWEEYSTYFIGPENLDEGDYKVEIISMETSPTGPNGDKENNVKTLKAVLDFSVSDSSE